MASAGPMASAGRCRWGMGAAGWCHDPDPGGVRLVRAWCLPLVRGVRRSVLGDRVVSGRPERCDGGWASPRPLAAAQKGRRQLPAAAAQGGRSRADPVAGTGGCAQGEPPGASVPPLCDGMASGSARPGQDRPPGGLDVAGHRRVAAADRDPGLAASIRDRHSRQVRSVASVMGRSDRDDRSGAHVLLR
jgi:hypothetical protein